MSTSDLLKGKFERSSISKLLLCAAPLLLAGCSSTNNIYGVSIPSGYTHITHGSFVNPDPGLEPVEKKFAEDILNEPNPTEQLTTPVDVSEPVMMEKTVHTDKPMSITEPMPAKSVPIRPVQTHDGGPIPLTAAPHDQSHAAHAHAAPVKPAVMTPAPVSSSANEADVPASYNDRWAEVAQTLVATLLKQGGTPVKPVYVTTVAGAPSTNVELEHSIHNALKSHGVSVLSEPTAKPVVLEYDVVRLGAGKSDQALVTFILYKSDGSVMEANRMFAVR